MSGEEELTDLHLADLHERAAARGISGYRMLRREELIARLSEPPRQARPRLRFGRRRRKREEQESQEMSIVAPSADAAPAVEPEAAAPPAEHPPEEPEEAAEADEEESAQRRSRRRGRRGGRGRRGRERERLVLEDDADATGSDADAGDERPASPAGERAVETGKDEPEKGEDEDATEVVGVLELTRQRHGFLRAEGLAAREDDVYVSASQVRRCELRPGDVVSGPARKPRRGERHRALIHVDRVNAAEPKEEGRPDFDAFTPVPPTRRIRLGEGADPLARAVDLLAPLAYGQRVLVRAAPRSGRTTLLRALGQAIAAAGEAELEVLLIDERPEELAAWRRALPDAAFALAPADLAPKEQVRVAELALERARRQVEAGRDVVLLCDSLSRLAVAAGGVDEVKRLFGSGRALEEDGAGSLTVIATVFEGGEDGGDAERAVITTETSTIALDPELAEEGITPALRFSECRAVGEAELRDPAEREVIRALREELRTVEPREAAERVRRLVSQRRF